MQLIVANPGRKRRKAKSKPRASKSLTVRRNPPVARKTKTRRSSRRTRAVGFAKGLMPAGAIGSVTGTLGGAALANEGQRLIGARVAFANTEIGGALTKLAIGVAAYKFGKRYLGAKMAEAAFTGAAVAAVAPLIEARTNRTLVGVGNFGTATGLPLLGMGDMSNSYQFPSLVESA